MTFRADLIRFRSVFWGQMTVNFSELLSDFEFPAIKVTHTNIPLKMIGMPKTDFLLGTSYTSGAIVCGICNHHHAKE